MDDFFANADSLDGDFKALLAMRTTQKLQAEKEEKLSLLGVEKFKKNVADKKITENILTIIPTEEDTQTKQIEIAQKGQNYDLALKEFLRILALEKENWRSFSLKLN